MPWLKHQKVRPHRHHDVIVVVTLLMVTVLLAVLGIIFSMQTVGWSSEDEL
jgi:hypothetical protein